ncbi:MAG: hypothetical protein WCY09_07945 [Candidatus Omnitrophota bacterium]
MASIKTETVGTGDNAVAVYWMGDNANPKQFGVCFPGEMFNIARQSLAESLSLANDMLTDAVDDAERESAG